MPLAEAQKTATLRIIETRISSVAKEEPNSGRRRRPTVALEQGDRPEGMGRTRLIPLVSGEDLANNDRSAIVIADHLFDERACRMIRSGAVGDDTRPNFQVQGDRLPWIERHYLVA